MFPDGGEGFFVGSLCLTSHSFVVVGGRFIYHGDLGFLRGIGNICCAHAFAVPCFESLFKSFFRLAVSAWLREAECPVASFGMSAPHLGLGWAREQGVVSLCMTVVHMRVHV